MVDVFASDYDGTLFKDRIIRDADLDAIRAFRARGNKFGIVTGRAVNSVIVEMNKYAIPVDFIVAINGGVVLTHDFKEIFASTMNVDVVRDMMNDIESHHVRFYGVNDGYRLGRKYLMEPSSDFEPNVELEDVETFCNEQSVRAMYVFTEHHDEAKILAHHLNKTYGHANIVAYQNVFAVDVGVKGVSKATGIQHVVDHYGYTGSIYAMGDSYNDIPMLEAYHGFVMENGEEAVKAYGKKTFNTVGDALNYLNQK